MYDKSIATLGTATSAGALAVTGIHLLWYVLAGFALVAAGLALVRIAPRSQA